MELSAAQRERYERNLLVEGFTDRMQQALIAARVAVVGAGGLGSAALNYLVAAGVGHLTLIENDTVSLSNLQRQVLYTTADMGPAESRSGRDAPVTTQSRVQYPCRDRPADCSECRRIARRT